MTTVVYSKNEDFTAGTNESGCQPAASGDLIGASHGDDAPPEATLPGSYKIGSAAVADVYDEVAWQD